MCTTPFSFCTILSQTNRNLQAKRASKQSWEEGRKVAADICSASDEEKARWLWESYSAVTGSSQIERGGLEGEHIFLSEALEISNYINFSRALRTTHIQVKN